MSAGVYCHRQEECPVVLGACERKVKAEAHARVIDEVLKEKEAEYARRRVAMNELFAAGVALRRAQAGQGDAGAAEARFDRALQACRALGRAAGNGGSTGMKGA